MEREHPAPLRRGVELLERLPNIPTQVGLGENFQRDRDLTLIQNLDDLAECYRKIGDYIQNLQQESGYKIMTDYTAGTKTPPPASTPTPAQKSHQ